MHSAAQQLYKANLKDLDYKRDKRVPCDVNVYQMKT